MQQAAAEGGFYVSFLAPSYDDFDRELFVATLNDWGWKGREGAAPEWYTGEPWSD